MIWEPGAQIGPARDPVGILLPAWSPPHDPLENKRFWKILKVSKSILKDFESLEVDFENVDSSETCYPALKTFTTLNVFKIRARISRGGGSKKQ